MKDYRIFLNKKDETWEQAINRFQRFREEDMKEYFPQKDYSYHYADNKAYNLYHTSKIDIGVLQTFSSEAGINIPSSLCNLMCNYGTFRIGDSLLEIFESSDTCPFLSLPQILEIYKYEDIGNKIGSGMLNSLSKFYYFFGVSFKQSEEISFLYYNKAGNFGKMLLPPGNEDLILKKTLPSMFNGSLDKFSLDSLISLLIDRVIINALTVRGYIN